MNKLRPLRFKNPWVDMAAMCDVACLLLFFFIATAQFEQWEPMKINVPASNLFNINLPGQDIAIIYIAGDKVMFQVVGDSIRKLTLSEMSKKYHVIFTAEEQQKFINSPIIGAPICELKQYDDQYMDWMSNINRPGIPYNDDQLFDWVIEARKANIALFGKSLRITIKADKDVKYSVLKRVIATLQKQKVNKFSLLTDASTHTNDVH